MKKTLSISWLKKREKKMGRLELRLQAAAKSANPKVGAFPVEQTTDEVPVADGEKSPFVVHSSDWEPLP